jgi:hypothetical protein
MNCDEAVVKRYHEALSSILTLLVAFDGWDYSCVDDALNVLAENIDALPTRVVLVERIEQRKREKEA